MAAGSFELIKQGDTKRMFYSAKNFGTGKTVAATPYDPSNSAQSGVSFTEIGTTGMYYYDWDSTAKTLGTDKHIFPLLTLKSSLQVLKNWTPLCSKRWLHNTKSKTLSLKGRLLLSEQTKFEIFLPDFLKSR